MRGKAHGSDHGGQRQLRDAPRPPGSSGLREPLGSTVEKPAAIRRCACTASEIRRCRSAAVRSSQAPGASRYAMRSACTIQAPCGIFATGPCEAVLAHHSRHRVAVYDHRAGAIQHRSAAWGSRTAARGPACARAAWRIPAPAVRRQSPPPACRRPNRRVGWSYPQSGGAGCLHAAPPRRDAPSPPRKRKCDADCCRAGTAPPRKPTDRT